MIIINGDLVKNFKFSIVTLIDDVERIIDNSIKAILNQTIDFEENIQLISAPSASSTLRSPAMPTMLTST